MESYESVTVLTTEERVDLFKAVFGNMADYVFNPVKTSPLCQYLTNLRIGRGSAVVLDETHFPTSDIFATGIREYVDSCAVPGESMRIIVVCSGRKPGDGLLAFLTMYCHVYDIVCAIEPLDLVSELEQLVHTPNKRTDVLPYMRDQTAFRHMNEEVDLKKGMGAAQSGEIVIPAGMKVKIVIEPMAG